MSLSDEIPWDEGDLSRLVLDDPPIGQELFGEDSLEPLGTSDNSLYDTASVKEHEASGSLNYDDDNGILGYKASGSLIRNDNSGILRLSVQGFDFSESGRSCWEDVEISRAGHRTVAIQLLDIKNNPQDQKKGPSLVIDLDHVLLDPLYIHSHQTLLEPRCRLRVQENAKLYLLGFEAMQDVLKFQEVFTGFSVQTHIPDVNVYLCTLPPKRISTPTYYRTAIQLWRKVPTQHESFNLTTDAPHNQLHAWDAEEGKARSKYEAPITKTDPTTASNISLNLSNGSAMETSASSLLVFSGEDILRESQDGPWWASIPLDGRVPSTRRCMCGKSDGSCKHITFDKHIDPSSYWRELSPGYHLPHSHVSRPTVIRPSVSRPSVIGMNNSRPLHSLTATPSGLPRKSDTITQDLEFVELEFRTIEDKMGFKAAYDALRRLAELEGFRRQNQPLLREGELPSNYRSPREQGSLTTEYESAAVDADNMIPTVAPKGANTITTPLYRAKAVGPPPRRSPPYLAGHSSSHFRVESPAAAAESLRTSERSDIPGPHTLGALASGFSSDSLEIDVAINDGDPKLRKFDKSPRSRSLKCPFHFLDCEKKFHKDRKREWVEHSLTHFETHKANRYAGLVKRVEPPRSFCCYFCKTEFSRLSGTDCWNDYMNHIHRCGLGYKWVPPDLTLVEYLWQEDIISDDTYRWLRFERPPFIFEHNLPKVSAPEESEPSASFVWETSGDEEQGFGSEKQVTRKFQRASIETSAKREEYRGLRSEHHPFSALERNMARVSAPIESEPSASSVWETSGDEEQGFGSEKQVNRKIQRASIETSTKREQWRRRICRRLVVLMLWKREQDVCIPNELWSSPASFDFIKVLEMSTLDKIKGFFETYSGREWNWWPFSAAAKPLESGKVRIRWQCACGDQRWTDASEYLTRKCQALVNENTTAEHEPGNATSQSAGSVAGHLQIGSAVPGSFPSDASQLPGDTSNICSTAQASHIQNSSKNPSSKNLYVLFCIYQKSQILHSQILATKCQNDEAFFENLRQEYRRLRGFFRFWFSPLQFSHCDFVKFTRFYVNELAKVGHSLPNDLIYEYNPRPPGPHDDPPISAHEFNRRFYTPLGNPCGRSEALERIPKRQKRFQINLHVDGREDMWGLLVELQPCFLVVLMWQIAITGGGWAFMGWWLSRHHGDLQGAAMPITLIITALMALWAPIGKGMRETL